MVYCLFLNSSLFSTFPITESFNDGFETKETPKLIQAAGDIYDDFTGNVSLIWIATVASFYIIKTNVFVGMIQSQFYGAKNSSLFTFDDTENTDDDDDEEEDDLSGTDCWFTSDGLYTKIISW